MSFDIFKDIIPSILKSKKDLSKDEDFDKSYNAYIINKALSYHYDTVLQANEMNKYPSLSSTLQYHYLLNTIRSWNRPFRPWQKRETIDNLDIVKEYFGYSNEKAKEVLVLLDANQIEDIKKQLYKGGTNDSKPRRVRGSKTS